MGEPFPASYVPLLFADAVTGAFSGSHNGSHIAIMPDYDVDDGSPEALQAGAVIAHEVAHYYWRWSQPWLDEGAAEFIAAYVDHKRSGLSLEPVNYPCDSNQTIRRLEGMTLYTTDSGYVCNYAVGERFFPGPVPPAGRRDLLERPSLAIPRHHSVRQQQDGTDRN